MTVMTVSMPLSQANPGPIVFMSNLKYLHFDLHLHPM
jgi:hypothetical protein